MLVFKRYRLYLQKIFKLAQYNMIIQFTVENFLSFKEPATLSLVASALKEKQPLADDVVFELDGVNMSLLKSAVVYGANASGKSNLIKALDFFKWFVINSSKGVQSSEKIQVGSFRLHKDTEMEPSYFEVVFADVEFQYRYGFELDANRVYREWLYQKANKRKSKEVELFFRSENEYTIHQKYAVGKEVVSKKMVRDNALLLSVAAQFNESVSVDIMKWLADTTIVTGSSDERIWDMAALQMDNPEMRHRIVAFAQFADFGISDIRKVDNTIISSHLQYDEAGKVIDSVTFPFRKNESEGTIKYFSLAYPIIDALDNGKRLIIDEFDSKMHPLLTSKIISLFNSSVTNPRKAQLVFTTHDTNLLNAGLFRRDQIWFTQKDMYGASELYSLVEYKVRNSAPYEKEYLMGKYGGIPLVGQFERLFDANNDVGYGKEE